MKEGKQGGKKDKIKQEGVMKRKGKEGEKENKGKLIKAVAILTLIMAFQK
jgi:hypothetical protein